MPIALAARRESLPRFRTSLIGREDAVAQWSAVLRRPDVRLVTLTGTGGIGKTRLAIAVAQRLADEFIDGIDFVSLAAIRDPERVLAAIASALDVREAGQRSLVDSVASVIGKRRMLLVLDNFEQVLHAASVVDELLVACPRLSVLVTSRAALRLSGERIGLVTPLLVPDPKRALPLDQLQQLDAIRLFVERAQAARADFVLTSANAPAIIAICVRLDGLPLALELAAARIRLLSPRALLAQLEHRLRLLTSGPQDQPVRLQTLRNTIAWSYDLLEPDQQRLFRRLAVFAGGWTLEAAEAVFGAELDVLAGLSLLVDHSLVQPVEQVDGVTRFAMLETIREYAVEQLTVSDEVDAIRARHAAFYLALAEEGHPEIGGIEESGERYPHQFAPRPGIGENEIGAWLGRLEPEQDNLRAALAWLLGTTEVELALRLASALGTFWFLKSHLREGIAWLERALIRGEMTPVHLRARARLSVGFLALFGGDYARATAHFEASQALWGELHDELGILEAMMGLATTAEYLGDDARAISLCAEVLPRARGRSDRLTAFALVQLADAAYRQGDLDRAAALSEEALVACRENPPIRVVALLTVAQVALARGERERAARLYADCLTASQQLTFPEGPADALSGFAGIAVVMGQPKRAARLLGAVVTQLEAFQRPIVGHHAQHQRALAATRAALSPEVFERAFAEGLALTLDDAIAETGVIVAEVSATPALPTAGESASQHGLTLRELDVLRLLVEGQSNQEIAGALFISPSTVASHVVNILSKLRVESRTAAATWALRHGLADS